MSRYPLLVRSASALVLCLVCCSDTPPRRNVVADTPPRRDGMEKPKSKADLQILLAELEQNDTGRWYRAKSRLEKLGPADGDLVLFLIEAFKAPTLRRTETLAVALGNIGPAAVPALIEALRSADPEIRNGAAFALSKVEPGPVQAVAALVSALEDPEVRVRTQAAWALENIGLAAQDAIPALEQSLRDSDEGFATTAARALGAIGPAAVQALTAGLDDPRAEIRHWSAYYLGLAAKDVKAGDTRLAMAIGRLRKLLRDPDSEVRSSAAVALGNLGPNATEAISELTSLLNDPDQWVRREAIAGLGAIGAEAVPALVRVLREPEPQLRASAASALALIGAPAREAVPALLEAFGDSSLDVRKASAGALGAIGPEAQSAIPALAAAMREVASNGADIDPTGSGQALGKIGAAAIPVLQEALRDPDDRVRSCAAWAFNTMGPAAREAVPLLVEKLAEGKYVREGASSALASIGPAAVPALLKALEHEKPTVREGVAEALGAMGAKAREAVPSMAAVLEREASPDVRFALSRSFGKIGPAASAAIPVLAETLRDENAEVRVQAAHALVDIGVESVPAAIAALEDDKPQVRYLAIRILGSFGPKAKAAAPALAEAAEDSDERISQVAIAALDAINR